MTAEKILFTSVREATEAIDLVGSDNSAMMATRAIHINVLVRAVPGDEARMLKWTYNDVGAEAAISRHAYRGEEGAVTDMIVMGTVYQHREVRRVLADNPVLHRWIAAIEKVVESARETLDA